MLVFTFSLSLTLCYRKNDLTTSIFERSLPFTEQSKSVSRQLYNVQKSDDEKAIQFIEPCPRVEWAGELKRDKSFVVNKESITTVDGVDEISLQVTAFNPKHGQSTFQDMKSNRLENVILWYREVGSLKWLDARTLVPDGDGGETNEQLDFAANYAGQDPYGYYVMKWELGGMVSEGQYEIKLQTQCEISNGPDDIDMYMSPILPGAIDLTRPEQYGQPLPLRDTVMIGEEITIVFSEAIRCSKPHTFDLSVIIEGTDYALDREELQVVCEGRKISFQIDPTIVDVEVVMGKVFSVELGTIGVESVSNVYDVNGNSLDPLKGNIFFKKTLANMNLEEASTTFTFTLDELACAEESGGALTMEIKERIVELLGLPMSDTDRVEIQHVTCIDGNQVQAHVLLPPSSGGGRFLRAKSLQEDKKERHSMALYQELLGMSGMRMQSEYPDTSALHRSQPSSSRKLGEEEATDTGRKYGDLSFTLSNLNIVPSATDLKTFATSLDLQEEEEELYRFASSTSSTASSSGTIDNVKHVVMKTTDRKALVEELEISTRDMVEEMDKKAMAREEVTRMHEEEVLSEIHTHEEELLSEIHRQQTEMKQLQMEFCVVAVACVIIGSLSLFKLKG